MAERVITEKHGTATQRINYAFRLAACRYPKPLELRALQSAYDRQLSRFQRDKEAAKKFLSVGESIRNEKLDISELAALSAVCSIICNLDEVITKG